MAYWLAIATASRAVIGTPPPRPPEPYSDPAATLDDLREAVTMVEDTERIARRVLGGAHPNVAAFEKSLRDARATLRARETPNA